MVRLTWTGEAGGPGQVITNCSPVPITSSPQKDDLRTQGLIDQVYRGEGAAITGLMIRRTSAFSLCPIGIQLK